MTPEKTIDSEDRTAAFRPNFLVQDPAFFWTSLLNSWMPAFIEERRVLIESNPISSNPKWACIGASVISFLMSSAAECVFLDISSTIQPHRSTSLAGKER
jgi:hypothetical protein